MDTLSTEVLLLAIVVLIVLSAYFSGSETALTSINRYRLRHLERNQNRSAAKVSRMLQRPDRMLGVILIGNNLVNIMAASLGTVIGLRLLGDWGPLGATVILTLVFLIFAEVTPKTIAACFPEKVSFASIHLLTPLFKLLYPAVLLVNAISNQLAALVGVRVPRQRGQALTETLSADELRTLVHEGAAALDDKGTDMMLGVLDLGDIKVNEIMVPKAEIISLDLEQSMSAIVNQISASQHTRLPLVEGGFNQVHGILHVRKAIAFISAQEKTKEVLLKAVEEASFIPEGTPLLTQLINFQKNRDRIALVVDEYGDVQGIVTIEDILEEIVGDFTGNDLRLIPAIQPQADGSYLIDGAVPLRQINRSIGWDLPLDGPKTLNGLIVQHLDMIPESNTCIKINSYHVETIQILGDMVRLAKINPPPKKAETHTNTKA